MSKTGPEGSIVSIARHPTPPGGISVEALGPNLADGILPTYRTDVTLRRSRESLAKLFEGLRLLPGANQNLDLIEKIYRDLAGPDEGRSEDNIDSLRAIQPINELIRAAVVHCFNLDIQPADAIRFFESPNLLVPMLKRESKRHRNGEADGRNTRILTGEHKAQLNTELRAFAENYRIGSSITDFLSALANKYKDADVYYWFSDEVTVGAFCELIAGQISGIITEIYINKARGSESLDNARKFIEMYLKNFLKGNVRPRLNQAELHQFYDKVLLRLESEDNKIWDLDDLLLETSQAQILEYVEELHIENIVDAETTLRCLADAGIDAEPQLDKEGNIKRILVRGDQARIQKALFYIYNEFASSEGEYMDVRKMLARKAVDRSIWREYYELTNDKGEIDHKKYEEYLRAESGDADIEQELARWRQNFEDAAETHKDILEGAGLDARALSEQVGAMRDQAETIKFICNRETPQRLRREARILLSIARLINNIDLDRIIAYAKMDARAIESTLEPADGIKIHRDNPEEITFWDYPKDHLDSDNHLNIVTEITSIDKETLDNYTTSVTLLNASTEVEDEDDPSKKRTVNFRMVSTYEDGEHRVVHLKTRSSVTLKHMRELLEGNPLSETLDLHRAAMICENERDQRALERKFKKMGGFGAGIKVQHRKAWKRKENEHSADDYSDTTIKVRKRIADTDYGEDNRRFSAPFELKIYDSLAAFLAQKSRHRAPGHNKYRRDQNISMVEAMYRPDPDEHQDFFKDENAHQKGTISYKPKWVLKSRIPREKLLQPSA